MLKLLKSSKWRRSTNHWWTTSFSQVIISPTWPLNLHLLVEPWLNNREAILSLDQSVIHIIQILFNLTNLLPDCWLTPQWLGWPYVPVFSAKSQIMLFSTSFYDQTCMINYMVTLSLILSLKYQGQRLSYSGNIFCLCEVQTSFCCFWLAEQLSPPKNVEIWWNSRCKLIVIGLVRFQTAFQWMELRVKEGIILHSYCSRTGSWDTSFRCSQFGSRLGLVSVPPNIFHAIAQIEHDSVFAVHWSKCTNMICLEDTSTQYMSNSFTTQEGS